MTTIEAPEGEDALTEFILFRDRVYEGRGARWPSLTPIELPTLTGESPFAQGRTFRPLVAREGGEIVARAAALVDQRYLERWDDAVGHLIMFEAMPGARDATKQLIDAASDWLREQGMRAARAGFGGGSDLPFVIDDYDTLPPMLVRHNPAYYHSLLKDAGFESEQGWVDYRIEVTPVSNRWRAQLHRGPGMPTAMMPFYGQTPDEAACQMWQWLTLAHQRFAAASTPRISTV